MRSGNNYQRKLCRPYAEFALFIALGLGALSGCGSISKTQIEEKTVCVSCQTDLCKERLEITYLGAAGFVIRYADDVLLLSPFFSNPNLFEVFFRQLESNYGLVDKAANRYHLSETDAIFLGHGHYDHALDVDYVATKHATNANIYGNETTINMLYGSRSLRTQPNRLVNASDNAISLSAPSDQLESRHAIAVDGTEYVKYFPISSSHSPHLFGITFFDGEVDEKMTKLPARVFDWKSGRNLSFMFEFQNRSKDQVAYRVYYMDSMFDMASKVDEEMTVPAEFQDSINVVIPSVALYQNVSYQPKKLVQLLKPDFIVLGHWDDFMQSSEEYAENPRGAFNTNIPNYIDSLENSLSSKQWVLPAHGVTTVIGSPASMAGYKCKQPFIEMQR